jgi:hypothetical protein
MGIYLDDVSLFLRSMAAIGSCIKNVLAPSLRDSVTKLMESYPTLKRGANKLCASGASLPCGYGEFVLCGSRASVLRSSDLSWLLHPFYRMSR